MAGRKKCAECLGCFDVFWLNSKRYYHCILCQTTYEGRDDDLQLCQDPRIPISKDKKVEEKTDGEKSE